MNKFTLHYKRSQRHINRKELDSLLLNQEVEAIGPKEYKYTGAPRIYNNMRDLEKELVKMGPCNPLRRFLDGSWFFEINGKRQRQLEETPEGMAARFKEIEQAR